MNIEIEISYTTNQFIFLSELSQWNDLICTIKKREQILKIIGDLSEKEKDLLNDFTKIFQESSNNLENIFLFKKEEEIWRELKKKLKLIEFTQIQNIFNKFQNKFDFFWQNKKEKLFQKEKTFKESKNFLSKYLEIIKTLSGIDLRKNSQVILLKLVINLDENDCQSWAFENVVVLESKDSNENIIDCKTLNIFLHEIFHILLKRNQDLFLDIKRLAEEINLNLRYYNKQVVFEEALISSFLPEGYLGKSICNQLYSFQKKEKNEINRKKEKKLDSLTTLRYFCAENTSGLVKEYIENSKSLDKYFLNQIYKCLESFKKENREIV